MLFNKALTADQRLTKAVVSIMDNPKYVALAGVLMLGSKRIEPDEAKNRMRRARGKAPLFTYKVLTIGKKKRKSQHQGGTHASPRSHLRRGYYRTSKHGVRHWVQPCMVKGETPGFVHKDYKVEGLTQGPNA